MEGIKGACAIHKGERVSMIIDCHVHMGITDNYYMPEDMILASMDRYGIDRVILSNIEGIQKLPGENLQSAVNEKAIRFARKYPDRISVLLWARPEEEGATPEFERLLLDNPDVVCGIKVHPAGSGVAISDERIERYAALGAKYGKPVLFHTAADEASGPEQLEAYALAYPNGIFILGHLGLRTDNEAAVRLILTYPNLYGGTAWVKPETALRIMEQGGEDKLLFGTDSPINGTDTYADPLYYDVYLNQFRTLLKKEQFEKLMYQNTMRLFRLK